MTIRLRLTLWYTALLGATLIFFSVIVYSALATNLQTPGSAGFAARGGGGGQRHWPADRERPAQLPEGEASSSPASTTLPHSVGVQVISLRGPNCQAEQQPRQHDGAGLYRCARHRSRRAANHRYRTELGGQPLLVYSAPLIIGGEVLGAVQIVRPIGGAENTLAQVSRYLIIGTGLSLIVAAVVGAFLARRELLPLDDITRTAGRHQPRQGPRPASDISRIPTAKSASWPPPSTKCSTASRNSFIGQERLVADVSHELRTPLTTIQGNMDLAAAHGRRHSQRAHRARRC